MLQDYSRLPQEMQCDGVRRYYDLLAKKRAGLALKRAFDIAVSGVMLLVLGPVLLLLAAAIKLDSPGPVLFRQQRVTANMKPFRIFKFRTMVDGADKKGPLVTVDNDSRVTRMGHLLRKGRLDELPQLINVLLGDMSFVGTRPEVGKYVDAYTDEMKATLLLPAGITSMASILYKDESALLSGADDPDRVYVETILPAKMRYNLEYLEQFSFFGDIAIMFRTVFAVLTPDKEERKDG